MLKHKKQRIYVKDIEKYSVFIFYANTKFIENDSLKYLFLDTIGFNCNTIAQIFNKNIGGISINLRTAKEKPEYIEEINNLLDRLKYTGKIESIRENCKKYLVDTILPLIN